MSARGFTLVELVVVVAVVGLLATGAMPLGKMLTQRMKETELRTALRDVRAGIDAYKRAVVDGRIQVKVDDAGYPPSLNALVEGVEDGKDPKKAKIHFMRRLPRDPFFPDPSAKAADTWGLRSYKSSTSNPQAGEDVYDIYSLARGVGLNGIPYRQW
jgi:general secretion pathway protein G